jgi:hypothetical protein
MAAVGLMSAAAQGGDPRIAFMQGLTRAAFPVLGRTAGSIVITMGTAIGLRWDRPADIFVDVHPEGKVRASSDPNHRYLRGDFLFAGDAFEMASFSGEVVSQDKRDAFDRMQRANRVTTDSELAAALSQLTAKFGPDHRDAFVAQLDLKRFEDVLGPIEAQTIDFESGLQNDSSYNRPPRWIARLRTQDGASTKCFVVLFEPFGGQVQAIVGPQTPPRDACGK